MTWTFRTGTFALEHETLGYRILVVLSVTERRSASEGAAFDGHDAVARRLSTGKESKPHAKSA